MTKNIVKKRGARPQQKSVGVTPLGDKVLIRPLAEDTNRTASGIYIPETSKKELPERGVVVAVGEGKRTEVGGLIVPAVAVGDTVLFSKYGFDEMSIDGTTYYVVSEGAILAVIH